MPSPLPISTTKVGAATSYTDGQIDLAVAVEITSHDTGPGRLAAHHYDPARPETPIAIAEQQMDSRCTRIIADSQILDAIAIEVSHRNACWTRAHGVIHRRTKSPVAIAQQHADRAAASDRRSAEIGVAIPIEVATLLAYTRARCQAA